MRSALMLTASATFLALCSQDLAYGAARDQLRGTLADPAATLMILAIGVLGICWELAASGLVIPGVVGSVCLVLAMYSASAAHIDPRGVELLTLAVALFGAEAAWPSRGLSTVAGVAVLSAGIKRIDGSAGWLVTLGASILFSGLISFLLSVAFAARRSKLAILKKGDKART